MIGTAKNPRPDLARKLNLMRKFVPVIFANGGDDDLPGLEAAVTNKAVQYKEKVYAPGEDIEVFKQTLKFSCAGIILEDADGNRSVLGLSGPFLTIRTTDGRYTSVRGCMMFFDPNMHGRG